jgi:hypothetical protein
MAVVITTFDFINSSRCLPRPPPPAVDRRCFVRSMTRILVTLVLVIAAGVAAGQRTPSDPYASDDTVVRLRWLDHADVKADFHRVVVEQHDKRFLVVGTLASHIPAGEHDPSDLVAQYGSRNFAIGCIIPGPEALRLRKKADA